VAGGTISVGSSGAKCRFACVADLRAAGAAVAFEPCTASPTGFCLALRAALNDAVRRTRCRLLLLFRLVLGFLVLGVGGAASGAAAAVSHTNPAGRPAMLFSSLYFCFIIYFIAFFLFSPLHIIINTF
jgi:hypothetical protein